MKTYIGIDNGTSGSIGIIQPYANRFLPTPIIIQDNYTKPAYRKLRKGEKKRKLVQKEISRLDHKAFRDMLFEVIGTSKEILVVIERPMVNPMRFFASLSAVRCLESQIVALEDFGIKYVYIDSKEWQKALLPKGTKGTEDLKEASLQAGNTLWPQYIDLFLKQGDADSLLIAEYAKMMAL